MIEHYISYLKTNKCYLVEATAVVVMVVASVQASKHEAARSSRWSTYET